MIKSKKRVRDMGEVFTPPDIVLKMIELIPYKEWKNPSFIVLEPTCGNGNFLEGVVKKKMDCGLTFLQALNTTFGTDICPENIDEARHRLLFLKKVRMDYRHIAACIIHHNIFVVEDFLKTTSSIQGKPFFRKTKGLSTYVLNGNRKENRGFLSKAESEKAINKVKNKIKNIKTYKDFDFVTTLGDNSVFNDCPELENDQQPWWSKKNKTTTKKEEKDCQRYKVDIN